MNEQELDQNAVKYLFRMDSVSLVAVRKEMEAKEKSLAGKILTLAITLFIFAGAGLLSQDPLNLALLVLVILIHETGHWLGMKFFKYNDVQMFFIPGFGAAVSGTENNPCARQKAIVALLGPIPGIIIGLLCIVGYAVTKQQLWSYSAAMFLVINSFNLLPITPLDGGRFVEALFFTKHPRAEVVFKAITALIMGYLAYQWKSIGLGLLAYISIVTIKNVWATAQSSKALNPEFSEEDFEYGNEIPDEWLDKIILSLDGNLSEASRNPKGYAASARTIWNRIRVRHCSTKAIIGLTAVYLLFLTPIASLVILSKSVQPAQEQQKTTANQSVHSIAGSARSE
jgi:Zn-dependent protease